MIIQRQYLLKRYLIILNQSTFFIPLFLKLSLYLRKTKSSPDSEL